MIDIRCNKLHFEEASALTGPVTVIVERGARLAICPTCWNRFCQDAPIEKVRRTHATLGMAPQP